MNWETATFVARIAQGALPLLTAMIATYIAYEQWRANRLKLRLDLYQGRFDVYRNVIKFLSTATNKNKFDTAEWFEFTSATAEAEFLFGSDVRDYLRELRGRALNLRRAATEYRDLTQPAPDGYDHKATVDTIDIEMQWLISQQETATEVFRKYLDLSGRSSWA